MNDQSLKTALERSVAAVEASMDTGEVAWSRARRESRRNQVAVVGVAGLAAAVIVALVAVRGGAGRSAPPVTTPTTSDATTATTLTDPHEEFLELWQNLSQPAWEDDRVDELPRLTTRLPQVIDPFGAPAASLSDDPLSSAVAVAQPWETQDVRVLGQDGRWRVVDTTGLEAAFSDGFANSLIDGQPISPDGTQLALPQPGSLVLVDLSSGTRRRIDLPQDSYPNWVGRMTQWSPDGKRVLVGTGHTRDGNGSWLVDVTTEAVEVPPYNAIASSFGADGTLYELRDSCGFCELRRYNGTDLIDTMQLQAELYVVRPAIGEAMAVSRAVRSWTGSKHLPANSDGLLIVDPDSGEPLAFMPMRNFHQVEGADLVGWLDDQTLLFSVFAPGDTPRSVLASWDYVSGEVALVAQWPDAFRLRFAANQL